MREISFIKKNKSKWLDFEQSLNLKQSRNPDELADAYIQLLNDLSYSQTYYPKSKTTEYLNFLVTQIYRKIYKTKRLEKNRLKSFFFEEIPSLVYQYRKQMYFAFALFFFFVTLGAISAAHDDRFVRIILGDDYVNMTLENIKNGDPMAVYKKHGELNMFIGITINNIGVAMKSYVYGLSAGVLTFFMSMQNGIMLGSFQYFFYENGVFEQSLRGIWLHGAMEIFSIVIATMAGFILAGSILFPGTYSRFQSFVTGARESLKILISTLPFFVAAGFIEGFVTRLSNTMPLWINVLIIVLTLTLISFYYLILPFIHHKKQNYARISTLPKT
ncbi:MAG TPA: stage II sporulation protein M [Paludibacter sp.]|nr:stage II sporulation protein M [Paludibacter sp.]